MAEIVWTEPAIADLDAIADYIAVENHAAARELVERVFEHAEQLARFPESGRLLPELGRQSRYRELIEPPCRIIYRVDTSHVFIVHVMRGERELRRSRLRGASTKT